MMGILVPANSCNPELPGCEPTSWVAPSLAILGILALGALMLISGVVVLVFFLVRRRSTATSGATAASPPQSARAGGSSDGSPLDP